LACGDQRRLTGNGSALEVVLHDYALYKSTFTLLYFTLLTPPLSEVIILVRPVFVKSAFETFQLAS